MREFDRVEDRIRAHRQVSTLPILVVEGPDDELVLRPHLTNVDIFPSDGKSNVLRVARQLKVWAIASFVCVTDSDFDDPAVVEDIADVHLPYDSRDLEAMLVGLGVLDTVLQHQGSAAKLKKLNGASELTSRISALVEPVTNLRAINAREGWGLAFDKVDLSSKIDQATFVLKVDNYCAALIQASQSTIKISEVSNAAQKQSDSDLGARGKDIVTAAGVALRKIAGTLEKAATVESVITAQLHSSCGLIMSRSEWIGNLQSRLSGMTGRSRSVSQ